MWWISAVVVDFPFDPVTAITRGGASIVRPVARPKRAEEQADVVVDRHARGQAAAITGLGAG
jgi:hypothetical protein